MNKQKHKRPNERMCFEVSLFSFFFDVFPFRAKIITKVFNR